MAKMDLEPFLVGFPMSGTHDPVSEFTEHDNRHCSSMLPTQDGTDFGLAIDKRR
jgi:hypothetical protein